MTDTANPPTTSAPTNQSDDVAKVAKPSDPSGNNFASTGSMSKESEASNLRAIEVDLDLAGIDIDLPKEVKDAGVVSIPTGVQIPKVLADAGVKPSGQNIPPLTLVQTQSVVFPLSDDQIAQGLNQGIESSWRWAAEYFIRRLKQLHIIIKNVGGKITRVKMN